MTNDKANDRRRRGVWLGLLVVLLLALAGVGYAVSSSPSASTGPEKGKPSATPSGSSSTTVSPPQQTAAPGATGGTGNTGGGQLVLAPAANTGNGNGNGNGVGNCNPESESANCVHHFGVTVGHAPTLYPGLTRALPVTYSNPNNFDIFVKTYRVTVVSANATACPASNLLVPSGTVTLSPTLRAAKNGSVTTTIPVQLAAGAPDACQLVTFTVTIDATAVKK